MPVDSNFFDDLGADSMVMAQFCARVRKRPDLPSVSMKDIYQHPTIAGLATALGDGAPHRRRSDRTGRRTLAEVLADVLHVEPVPVDSNFFDDLGADSWSWRSSAPGSGSAPTCRRCRSRTSTSTPRSRGLATALAPVLRRRGSRDGRAGARPEFGGTGHDAGTRPTPRSYVLCGALQLLIFLGYVYLGAWLFSWGYTFMSAGTGTLDDLPARRSCSARAAFVAMCILPDRGEVGADRPVEAAGDPGLEP